MRAENGYGTVVCLDKTGKKRRKPWAVRITVGWSKDGKQQCKYLGYYQTQKEAKIALAQYHYQGLSLDINTVTFADIWKLWEDKNKEGKTEANYLAYFYCYDNLSNLHKKKFKDIKTNHLQKELDEMSKKYKYSMLSKTKSLIKQMYNIAIENDLAVKNYAEFVTLNSNQEEVGVPFTRDEITHLWTLNGKEKLADDILILIYLGTRIGETLNIKIEDIHLEERYIEIHGTKTKAAERIVPIHKDIIPLIEARMHQRYLFENKGQPWGYRAFNYVFNKLMDELKFDHKIHDCRKTLISYLYESGVQMETIRFIVGHAQQGVTASVYLKVKKNTQLFIDAIDKLVLK